MKLKCTWNSQMNLTGEADGHRVEMDTKPPLGKDAALTPKQLVLAGVAGCTAMDVVAMLKKYKQVPSDFWIDVDAPTTERGYPSVFTEIRLTYRLKGELQADRVVEAVTLSQTKYCGVSAMLSQAVPVIYDVELNGAVIASGKADFKLNSK